MDRRQRKTRQAIYDAFESLMSEEHYSQVTVAQIIERADIGRSTFYDHFETKDELTATIAGEMFDHIFDGVSENCLTHTGLVTTSLDGMLAHLLYHLRDNDSVVCGKLLTEGEPHYLAYFRERLGELLKMWLHDRPAGVPDDLQLDLLESAFCEAVSWWFAHKCKQKPEQIASWYVRTLALE